MRIEMNGVGFKIGPQLEGRITGKLEKFSRYFDDKALAQVKCSKDGPSQRKVEITLFLKKHIYRAERSAGDIFTAVDLAVDVLEGQIRKHKTKIEKQISNFAYMKEYLKHEVPDPYYYDEEEMANGEEDGLKNATFRYKSFELRPMSREEAALQMEMLGHDFFLYLDDESGNVNLVYRKKDGNYGIIVPEYTK